MKTPIVDGQSIDQFIPSNLSRMFYKHPMPQYKYATHDGYPPYGFTVNGLVLYLPLWALKGSPFKSVDAYKMTATATSPIWTPSGRDFNPLTPDYIEIPADQTQLDFTSENFSIIARIKVDDVEGQRQIFTRGIKLPMPPFSNGYLFTIGELGHIRFETMQSTVFQATTSDDGEITVDTWFTVGFSRSGTSCGLYKNGENVTANPGTHTDPATSSCSAKIGIDEGLVCSPFDGKIESLMVYNRALSAGEHLHTHNCLSWRT